MVYFIYAQYTPHVPIPARSQLTEASTVSCWHPECVRQPAGSQGVEGDAASWGLGLKATPTPVLNPVHQAPARVPLGRRSLGPVSPLVRPACPLPTMEAQGIPAGTRSQCPRVCGKQSEEWRRKGLGIQARVLC